MRVYTRKDIEKYSCFEIPHFLFYDAYADLSNDARMLYGLLYQDVKHAALSTDTDDELYCLLDRKQMQEKLGISPRTLARIIKYLEDKELILQERQGGKGLNRVYICHPF